MAKLTTVYWRDIPAQVIAKERRDTAKIVLTERFAEAIDKAAMRAKMAGTDAYLEQWRREVVNCSRDLQLAVDEAAAKLEKEYDDTRLDSIVSNGGIEEGA
ncbi:MAG: virulence factor [Pseudomonadota bacterium]